MLPVQALIKQKMELLARQFKRTTNHPLNTDSNNLPSSSATSSSVNQTENGISREIQPQQTTDHPLNTDSNNLSWSSATSGSVNQTENGIARETPLQRRKDHPLNTDSNNLS